MKNQEQGSPSRMVGQSAHRTQDLVTFPSPLTSSQADKANRFLELAGLKTKLEATAEQPQPVLSSPAQEPAPPPWLVTPEEFDRFEREQAQPRVRVQVELEKVARLEELVALKKYRPKRGRGAGTAGAGRLAALLYGLMCRHLQAHTHLYGKDGSLPRQVVLHLSAEMLAAQLGVSDNTVREWASQLAADGFLAVRAHYTTGTTLTGEQGSLMDGTLYAVRVVPGHTARLRWQDMKRAYRNLDADRAAGRTAHNAIRNALKRAQARAEEVLFENDVQDAEKNTSESIVSLKDERVRGEMLYQLQRWVVIPGDIDLNPVISDSEVFSPEAAAEHLKTVLDVIYLLPTLGQAHHSKRAALVGIMAATLARALDDQHSRNFYCRLIWDAWNLELLGEAGLQALAAQLTRLEVDRREWKELRKPAALLAYRLRAV